MRVSGEQEQVQVEERSAPHEDAERADDDDAENAVQDLQMPDLRILRAHMQGKDYRKPNLVICILCVKARTDQLTPIQFFLFRLMELD